MVIITLLRLMVLLVVAGSPVSGAPLEFQALPAYNVLEIRGNSGIYGGINNRSVIKMVAAYTTQPSPKSAWSLSNS